MNSIITKSEENQMTLASSMTITLQLSYTKLLIKTK